MSQEFEKFTGELKKALPYLPATLSYIFFSTGMGYFLVIYIGLPRVFFASGIGLGGIVALWDYFSRTEILKSAQCWWVKMPIIIHLWIIMDCIGYYFLIKAYLHEETIWKNLSSNWQKNFSP